MKAKPAPQRRTLIVEFFSHGGLIHYSWQLAQELARQAPEREVVLLTARHPEASIGTGLVRVRDELRTWNPETRPAWAPRRLVRWGRGLLYVVAWLQVLRTARRECPEIILLTDLEHRCDLWFVRHLRRLGRHRGWRLADIWHNVEAFERNRPRRLLRRPNWRLRLVREFDTVFVHGRFLAEQLQKLTGVGARVIAHGNQSWIAAQAGPDPGLDQRLQLPANQPLALLLGSWSGYKGIDVLVEALAAIAADRRPIMVIAGQPVAGVRPRAWRETARRLGIEAWLRWDERYVPTAEIAWYFRRADLIVLPYLTASQSGIAHLALTFGKPLVVTSAGSLAEIIDGNGLVVPAGDVGELARAMECLSGNPELRRRMGRRSAELATTRHGWDRSARTMLEAWAEAPARPMPLAA